MAALVLMSALFHLTTLVAAQGAGGEVMLEDGYTVSTVFDGDKSNFNVNPHSIHQSPPSDDLLILLDSVASTLYSLSLPTTTSNETVVKQLAGNGKQGYRDGDLGSASFNKPRSFAVDYKGNVYVADQRNHAIRKISKSGVTTIAGGYSQKAGRTDGPGRDASFSDDFELSFIPERCALMISDRGNRLVRQINLKTNDCTRRSGSVLGTTSAWVLGLGLSCLLGLIVGFVIHPYVNRYEGVKQTPSRWTWTHCLTSLVRQVVMLCCDIRSAAVKSTAYSVLRKIMILGISQLSLMFRPMMAQSRSTHQQSVSLLDLDHSSGNSSSSSSMTTSAKVHDQLKDLVTFDGLSMLPVDTNEVVEQGNSSGSAGAISSCDGSKIDSMIVANIVNFEEQASAVCSTGSLECSLGLVKRR